LAKALSACERALVANPQSGNAHQKKSWVYMLLTKWEYQHELDARKNAKLTVEEAEKALSMSQKNEFLYDMIGNSWMFTFQYESTHGSTDFSLIEKAIENFRKSIDINSSFAWTWNDIGVAQTLKLDRIILTGQLSETYVDEIVRDFEKA